MGSADCFVAGPLPLNLSLETLLQPLPEREALNPCVGSYDTNLTSHLCTWLHAGTCYPYQFYQGNCISETNSV